MSKPFRRLHRKHNPPLSKIVMPPPLARGPASPYKKPAFQPLSLSRELQPPVKSFPPFKPAETPKTPPAYDVPDTPSPVPETPKVPELAKRHYAAAVGYYPNRQPEFPSFDPKGKEPLKIGAEHKLEGTYRRLYYKTGAKAGQKRPCSDEEDGDKKKLKGMPHVILIQPVFKFV